MQGLEKLTKLLLPKWFKSEDEHLRSRTKYSWMVELNKLKSIQVSKQLTKLRELEVSGCSDFKELPGQLLNIWSRWRNRRHVAVGSWRAYRCRLTKLPELRVSCFVTRKGTVATVPSKTALWTRRNGNRVFYATIAYIFLWTKSNNRVPNLQNSVSRLVLDSPSKRTSRGEVSGIFIGNSKEHKGVGAASKLWHQLGVSGSCFDVEELPMCYAGSSSRHLFEVEEHKHIKVKS